MRNMPMWLHNRRFNSPLPKHSLSTRVPSRMHRRMVSQDARWDSLSMLQATFYRVREWKDEERFQCKEGDEWRRAGEVEKAHPIGSTEGKGVWCFRDKFLVIFSFGPLLCCICWERIVSLTIRNTRHLMFQLHENCSFLRAKDRNFFGAANLICHFRLVFCGTR